MNLSTYKAKKKLAVVDDFRTAKWSEIIPYPELVYQKSQQYLQTYATN